MKRKPCHLPVAHPHEHKAHGLKFYHTGIVRNPQPREWGINPESKIWYYHNGHEDAREILLAVQQKEREMTDVLTQKTVRSRKPHRCWGCAREFPAGYTLQLIESVDNGVWSRTYWCPVCQEVWLKGSYYEDIALGDLRANDDFWEETRERLEAIP